MGLRVMQRYRPYICPLERVMGHVPPGSSVLDVGCGCGLWLGLLAHEGRIGRGVGFDVAGGAIRAAEGMRRGWPGGERLAFERRDVEEGWPEGVFDVVSIIDVLHHVPPGARRGVVEEAGQHVRPGGRLIYKDMTDRGWRAQMNRLHDLVMARQWVRYTPAAEVEAWAAGAGLVLTYREDVTRAWYGHELRVFERSA